MRGLWLRVSSRVGHRGTVLLFFALVDFVYSLSLFKPPREAANNPTLHFISHVLPTWLWGALWGAAGIVLAVGAFRSRDRWAFAVAMFVKLLWGSMLILGWVFANLDRGWVSATIWLALAFMLYVVSTWPEPGGVRC